MSTVLARTGFELLVLPDGRQLSSPRSEDLVRAFAAAAAAGGVYPSQMTVSWLASVTPEFRGSGDYWSPYGLADGIVYVRSWARGAYASEARAAGVVQHVEPADWYSRASQQIVGASMSDRTRTAFEMARESWEPSEQYGASVVKLWTAVREAQQRGQLLTDPRKIKARCARVGVLPT